MIKWESEHSAFIPLFGEELELKRHLTSYHMNFLILSAAIQKQSLITNYKHIYIVLGVKSPKSCSKYILYSASCKLGFPIFYHHYKDFQAHPSFSTETIHSTKKQGKAQLVVLFTLQNRRNNLRKTSKKKINKV